MGTNYYLYTDVCEYCGRADERIHIGKSSGGWCFALRIYPDMEVNDLDDWIPLLMEHIIKDEYSDTIPFADMMDIITNRKWKSTYPQPNIGNIKGYKTEEEFFAMNHAVKGPNGLARHKIDGSICSGHGEGTWDLMIREFS